jgi:predicted PurR-regulated permease PerM
MSRMISFAVLFGILVVIGIVFFHVISGFIVPAFLAALLAVMFEPLDARVHKRLEKWGRYFTAGVSSLLVVVVVLGPAILIISLAVLEGLALTRQLGDRSVRDRLNTLRTQMQLDIPHLEDLRKIEQTLTRLSEAEERGETQAISPPILQNLVDRAQRLAEHTAEKESPAEVISATEALRESLIALQAAPEGSVVFDDHLQHTVLSYRYFKLQFLGGPYRAWLKEFVNPSEQEIDAVRGTLLSAKSPLIDVGGGTVSIIGRSLFGVVIMMSVLFFLFADGPKLLNVLISFSPLEERYVRELIREFERASRAIVLATLLSALAQGVLAGIGYYFADVGSISLLVLLTTMLAMVPFLGAASVWVSVCFWLYFYSGNTSAAIGLAVYGVLIISTADNIIKPLVLHGQSNLHPLLALLSILGGVQTLGPIGILVGPMSVVFLQTLVRILHREYKAFENRVEVTTESPGSNSTPEDLADAETT